MYWEFSFKKTTQMVEWIFGLIGGGMGWLLGIFPYETVYCKLKVHLECLQSPEWLQGKMTEYDGK
jgi:hypothetical protein